MRIDDPLRAQRKGIKLSSAQPVFVSLACVDRVAPTSRHQVVPTGLWFAGHGTVSPLERRPNCGAPSSFEDETQLGLQV